MNLRLLSLTALATSTMAPLAAQATAESVIPRFAALPMHTGGKHYPHPPAPLQTWNGGFTYQSHSYTYTMVGTNPASTNTTTTITVYVVPVKMTYGKKVTHGKKVVFDPMVDQQNGVSIVQNVLNSPLFNALDWQWGPTDVGTTQYEDAYQRGSFWGNIGAANAAYHLILAPSVLSEVTINVGASQGTVEQNPFGGSGKIGTYPYSAFQVKIDAFIAKFSQINPTNLALFVTDNIYLTSRGGCCVAGYHSAENNGQSYAYATYISGSQSFTLSSDIDGLSHEVSEWIADPFINNSNQPCGGILEVGDPLEGKTNFGTFAVNFGGVTWHPQAEVFISYFGAPASGSVNGWLDNQHLEASVCEDGQ